MSYAFAMLVLKHTDNMQKRQPTRADVSAYSAKRQRATKYGKKYSLTNNFVRAIIHRHLRVPLKYRGVEQLEARRAHNPEVVGSSPASATKNRRFHHENGGFLNF